MNAKGFTLIEVLFGTAIFLIVAVSAYNAFASLLNLGSVAKARTLAIALADEQFEIVRNMPYISVGLTNGIPQGILTQNQTITRGGIPFNVALTVRNINLSTSTVQASDKLVEVDVTCPTCSHFGTVDLTGQVSPANLQSASNGGALVVHVFDSNGQPIENAQVTIQSLATSSVQDTDFTDDQGTLNVIGVPAGVNVYRITVTKAGYSTDRTYPIGGSGNPNPSNPDATVLNQQVTGVSLSIDKLSTLTFGSVSPTCVAVGSIPFALAGSKLIGTGAVKYPSHNLSTNSSGSLNMPNMEWDTYTITPIASSYDIAGINPFSPLILNPNNTQNVQLVVMPTNGNSIMISVEDGSTKMPISGATVELTGPLGYDQTMITGQGYLKQSDWTHGPVQNGIYADTSAYASDNGNVDTNTSTSSGNITLHWWTGTGYQTGITGTLESSTFDTGTTSNFYVLNWSPVNQPHAAGNTPVQFQFSTSMNQSGPWNYVGPDGTAGTYFNVPGGQINTSLNNNRYARYKAYLSTITSTTTPMVSDVSFSYASACIPPGQVLFQGLSVGSYTVTVSASGFTTYSGSVTVGSGWQQKTVVMAQ